MAPAIGERATVAQDSSSSAKSSLDKLLSRRWRPTNPPTSPTNKTATGVGTPPCVAA